MILFVLTNENRGPGGNSSCMLMRRHLDFYEALFGIWKNVGKTFIFYSIRLTEYDRAIKELVLNGLTWIILKCNE